MEVDTELITGRVLGRGLNSLRVRFTIIIGVFCSLVAALVFYLLESQDEVSHALTTTGYAKLIASIAAASGFTYYMTGRLTRPIQNLKASTEAIASGTPSVPITMTWPSLLAFFTACSAPRWPGGQFPQDGRPPQ